MQNQYPSTKHRISNDIFIRDYDLEQEYGIDDIKLYCYYEDEDDESLRVTGEIFASNLKKPFCIMCTAYDHDDDIIYSSESQSYGSGLVTSMIYPETFFDGYPFTFLIWNLPMKKVKEITLIPQSEY